MYELGGPLEGVRVPTGSNLLVVGPPLTGKRRLAYEVLAHGVDRDQGALVVTNTDPATRIRDELRPFPDGARVGIVDCVTKHQGGTPTESNVHYASSPEDMTGVGIGVSAFLNRLRDADGNRTVLTSLTTLLVYSNLQTVFRFLHVFVTRVENARGIGLYVLHESVHDDGAVSTLNRLFDGVVRTTEGGSPEPASLPSGAEID